MSTNNCPFCNYGDTVNIIWTWRDVKTLHPDWSEDKCKSYLMKLSKTLQDRSLKLLEAIEWAWVTLEDQ